MRKVVDSNYLRDPRLRSYLAASQENLAVLTDYAAMEAYKGNTLVSIQNSMAILAEFPTQVMVLKNTLAACGLSGRPAGLQRRLIDEKQTKGFPHYCRQLAAARAGNRPLQSKLLDMGRDATHHLEERMLTDVRAMPTIIEQVAAIHTPNELLVLRKDEPYSDDIIKKLIVNVLHLSLLMFKGHPRVQRLPDREDFPNTFIFRAALCAYLLALDWISIAGAKGAAGASVKTMRNDMVDVNFAAFATYFDDLLSGDEKTHRIYDRARLFLSRVFGCQISGLLNVSAPE